jgi:hypothetical protein
VTWSKFQIEDRQLIDASVENFVPMVTPHPGFV